MTSVCRDSRTTMKIARPEYARSSILCSRTGVFAERHGFSVAGRTEGIWSESAICPGNGQQSGQAGQSRLPKGSGTVDATPVKPVNAAQLADVKKSAARIDELIDANLKKNSQQPNGKISDAVFVRRTYLHLAGRIPKFEEAVTFLSDKAPDKRAKLIDHLLNSQDHVSHMFNYWGNILRLQDHPLNNNQFAQPYHEWIKKSLAENTPYDQWVTQMITAEGRIWTIRPLAIQLAMRHGTGPRRQHGSGLSGHADRLCSVP